jgi:MAST domain-containing protein
MKITWIFSLLIVISLTSGVTFAASPYGSMDVYYNDRLLPGDETAKPTLKIGEPFKVKINLTVYQKSDIYVSLSCMEKNSFKIITGPTSKIEEYSKVNILEANCSKEYEWIVEPTERWKGGSLPLDIYYTILAHGESEPLINSGFTVAYPYISADYYKGKAPVSKKSTTETQTPSQSAPAFTTISALLSGVLALALFRR